MSEFTIKVASKISGVGIHTIRAWERRYRAINPKRDDRGNRIFTSDDIKRLILLSELCSLGQSIGKIAHMTEQDLEDVFKSFNIDSPLDDFSVYVDYQKKTSEITIPELLESIQNFEYSKVIGHITKNRIEMDERELVFNSLIPLIEKVDEFKRDGKINDVAFSAFNSLIRFELGPYAYRLQKDRSADNKKILICAPDNDYEEIKLIIASILVNSYGKNFMFLGPNLPWASLVDSYEALKPSDILIINNKFDSKELTSLETYISRVRNATGNSDLIFCLNFDENSFVKSSRSEGTLVCESFRSLDQLLKNNL